MAESFKEWVRTAFTPVVMVMSHPDVEATCQKNGLSFVDLLRPFCQINDINIPVRTVGEQSYRVTELTVRVYAAEDIHQPSFEVAEEHLRTVMGRFDDAHQPKGPLSAPKGGAGADMDFEALLKQAQRSPNPWFQEHRAELCRMLMFQDHDMIDHPVACMVALPSTTPDPVSAFLERAKGPLPPLMGAGFMSDAMVKHFVLVHDAAVNGPPGAAVEEALGAMRASLGPAACHLLVLNAGDLMPAGWYDIWRGRRRATRGGCWGIR